MMILDKIAHFQADKCFKLGFKKQKDKTADLAT